MSQRNIRKVFGGTELPPPEDSDDEYEPPYTQKFNTSPYAGLEVSSDSESNDSVEEIDEDEIIKEEPKLSASKKRRNRKKKKQSKPKEDELDEIDRSIKEINAVLGEPEKPVVVEPVRDLEKIHKKLFTVRQHFFEAESELDRVFGPDDDDDRKKRGRLPNLRLTAQRGFIVKTKTPSFKKMGLSMILKERKDGYKYFVFEHSKNYQTLHKAFVRSQNTTLWDGGSFSLEESQRKMHVEGLLELADRFYTIEEYTRGNGVVEEIIYYMQYCAHPFFNVTDMTTRLEYKYMENRPFHIALMKYMHMLTNKACHRTALELAKLLLNLDPSDPLAVLFIIDTIAIRAREYQWLIEAIDFWNEDRDASFLFNMQYSYALATFHLARKTKEGFEKADELIQQAMLRFPTVVTNILQNSGNRNAKIKESVLFNTEANEKTMSSNLKDLIFLYARFIWNKFTEAPVLKWLFRNAGELIDKYENDPATQALAKAYANVRMNVFQTYPAEIVRHLSILTPLNSLIFDGAVPAVTGVVSYDPDPPFDGTSLYNCFGRRGDADYFEIFTSILPERDLQDASMDYVYVFTEMPRVDLFILEPPHGHRANTDESDTDTDSDTETDTDDDSTRSPLGVEPIDGSVRDFMGVYDYLFVRVPIEIREPPTQSEASSSSDIDDDDQSPAFLFGGPPIYMETDNFAMDDSEDEGDPVIVTMPIRNPAQFYHDLSESAVPRETVITSVPAEIDLHVRREERFSHRACTAVHATSNEGNVNENPQGEQRRNGPNIFQECILEHMQGNSFHGFQDMLVAGGSEQEQNYSGEDPNSTQEEPPPKYEDMSDHERGFGDNDFFEEMEQGGSDSGDGSGDDGNDEDRRDSNNSGDEDDDDDEDDDEDEDDEDEEDEDEDDEDGENYKLKYPEYTMDMDDSLSIIYSSSDE